MMPASVTSLTTVLESCVTTLTVPLAAHQPGAAVAPRPRGAKAARYGLGTAAHLAFSTCSASSQSRKGAGLRAGLIAAGFIAPLVLVDVGTRIACDHGPAHVPRPRAAVGRAGRGDWTGDDRLAQRAQPALAIALGGVLLARLAVALIACLILLTRLLAMLPAHADA